MTPEAILDAVRACALSEEIWLDVRSTEHNPLAAENYYVGDEGLEEPWTAAASGGSGLVFLDHRTHVGVRPWARKLRDESGAGAECLALLPSHTGAPWFTDAMFASTALCFIERRFAADAVAFCTNTRPWVFIECFKHLGICVNRGGGWYGG